MTNVRTQALAVGTMPLGLADLPEVSAQEVRERNRDLAQFSQRLYAVGGQDLILSRCDPSALHQQAGDVWASLSFSGSLLWIRLTRSWAKALADSVGVRLDDLHDETVNFLAFARLMPLLPQGVELLEVGFIGASPMAVPPRLEPHGCWSATVALTQEASGHGVEIWAEPAFATYAFLAAFDRFSKPLGPPRLSSLSLSLPLVAARWSVPSSDLLDLAVGDVLLLA